MSGSLMLRSGQQSPAGTIPVKLHMPAKVVIRKDAAKDDAAAAEELRKWTDSMMRLAKKRAPRSEIFETFPPFFWAAEISNDRRDSYHTRMAESTLRSFARGARSGVSFQYSHDWKRLGLGMSLKGTFEELKGGDPGGDKSANMRTIADFYTIPGQQMNNDMSTDSFINLASAGVIQDVSVGFYAGDIICGVCGGEMISFWGWMWGKDCDHYPGMEYDDEFGKGIAFAWIEKGVLSEVSQVYDGACPDAGIIKAQQWAESGRAEPARIRRLENHYRMKLPGGAFVMPVGMSPDGPSWASGMLGLGGFSGGTVPALVPGRADVAARKPDAETARKLSAKDLVRQAMRGDDGDAEDGQDDGTELADSAGVDADPEEVTEEAEDETEPEADEAEEPEAEAEDLDEEDDEESEDETDTGDDSAGETSGDEDDQRAMLTELAQRYRPHNIRISGSVRQNIEVLADAVIQLRADKRDLTRQARAGVLYEERLLSDMDIEGVRALGKKYDPDKWRKRVNRWIQAGDYREVEDLIAEFREQGDQRYANGRRSEDGTDLVDGAATGTIEDDRNRSNLRYLRALDEEKDWMYGRS